MGEGRKLVRGGGKGTQTSPRHHTICILEVILFLATGSCWLAEISNVIFKACRIFCGV